VNYGTLAHLGEGWLTVDNEELRLNDFEGGAAEPVRRETREEEDDDFIDVPEIPRSSKDLEPVYDIPVQVSAVLGKASMQVGQLLKLGRGAVVELDRKVGEAIDIYVNNRLVARGEVVVVEERLGVTMTEIIKTERG
jgi:flagellar motor switch protein FliN/FliY